MVGVIIFFIILFVLPIVCFITGLCLVLFNFKRVKSYPLRKEGRLIEIVSIEKDRNVIKVEFINEDNETVTLQATVTDKTLRRVKKKPVLQLLLTKDMSEVLIEDKAPYRIGTGIMLMIGSGNVIILLIKSIKFS